MTDKIEAPEPKPKTKDTVTEPDLDPDLVKDLEPDLAKDGPQEVSRQPRAPFAPGHSRSGRSRQGKRFQK